MKLAKKIFSGLMKRIDHIMVSGNKPIDLSDVKTVVFCELWGLGDLVFMLPAIRAFKNNYKDKRVIVLAKPHAELLFKYESSIDEIYCWHAPWAVFNGKYNFLKWDWITFLKMIKYIRKSDVDLSVDLRPDIRDFLLLKLLGIKYRLGNAVNGGKFLLTDSIDNIDFVKMHRIDAWKKFISRIVPGNISLDINLNLSDKEINDACQVLDQYKDKFKIAIHPGAKTEARRWPLDKYLELVERLSKDERVQVFVIIQPDGYGRELLGVPDIVAVEYDLLTMAAFSGEVTTMVCNDGGAMHLAVACKAKVLAIFGPTDPVQFGPYGDRHTVLVDKSFLCRPCFDYCVDDKYSCIRSIEVDEVFDLLEREINVTKSV